jgi:hypothetical protein
MRHSRFTDDQIIGILKELEDGLSTSAASASASTEQTSEEQCQTANASLTTLT